MERVKPTIHEILVSGPSDQKGMPAETRDDVLISRLSNRDLLRVAAIGLEGRSLLLVDELKKNNDQIRSLNPKQLLDSEITVPLKTQALSLLYELFEQVPRINEVLVLHPISSQTLIDDGHIRNADVVEEIRTRNSRKKRIIDELKRKAKKLKFKSVDQKQLRDKIEREIDEMRSENRLIVQKITRPTELKLPSGAEVVLDRGYIVEEIFTRSLPEDRSTEPIEANQKIYYYLILDESGDVLIYKLGEELVDPHLHTVVLTKDRDGKPILTFERLSVSPDHLAAFSVNGKSEEVELNKAELNEVGIILAHVIYNLE